MVGLRVTIVRLVRDDECQAVTSPALLDELHRVLIVKFEYPTRVADATLKRWRAVNAVVTPPLELRIIAADPSDNRVLECALAGEADAIVSGDRHLLALKTFRSIPIVAPHEFLAAWRQRHR